MNENNWGLEHVSVYLRRHATLFRGVSLTLGPGSVVGVAGGDGAGKTTLLRTSAWASCALVGNGRPARWQLRSATCQPARVSTRISPWRRT